MADYEKLPQNNEIFPVLRKCWSIINAMIKERYIWMNSHLKKYAPLKTEHQSSLHPWVSRKTSHPIKKVKTVKQQQQRHQNLCLTLKISRLENQITPMIEIDQQFAKLL